jgi:hypothetical protein
MADKVGSQGQQIIEVAVGGLGTPGTLAGGVVSVQGTLIGGLEIMPAVIISGENLVGTSQVIPVVAPINADAYPVSTKGLFTNSVDYLYNGNTWDRARTPAIFKPQSAVSIAAEATIWTPASGKKFRLMGGNVASSVVGNVTLRDGTAGTIIAVVPCGVANVAYPIFGPNAGNGILSALADNKLTATGPALSTLSGVVFGTEE